jgi:hypothetical protein
MASRFISTCHSNPFLRQGDSSLNKGALSSEKSQVERKQVAPYIFMSGIQYLDLQLPEKL